MKFKEYSGNIRPAVVQLIKETDAVSVPSAADTYIPGLKAENVCIT
ncbi:MAG: hypothetical protein FWC20_11840 [Oscillospiraceae bacterium]|nr:hypothetical protein [Oscillospiraceae bacterium]MCL2280075.1 hypothetical protein [Oscillospiraceae bacterium]